MTADNEAYFTSTLQARCLDPIPYAVYFGTFAHTPELGSLEVHPRTAVGVDDKGVIRFIAKECTENPLDLAADFFGISRERIKLVDMTGFETRFFFPGFIDTHIHAPQYPNNGIFGESTLLDWLNIYTFPLESSLKDLAVAKEVYSRVVQKTLEYGTTTAAYYATIHTEASKLLADTALRMGQRALVGKTCMNANSPNYYRETLEESKRGTLDVIRYIEHRDPSGDLVKPILTPRFAASCTEELLSWLGELRKVKGYHCQTHLSENENEIKWMAELFPQYANYTDIYYQNDLLGPRTVLAHCIHLTDDEKDLLVETKSGVSHCPTSNSSITSGEARVRWLLNSGINVSLGTDCSGGFSPSILEVARHALLVSHHLVMSTHNDKEKLSVKEVLYLATVGGSKVLDMEDKVGTFAVGKKFDAQLIDLCVRGSNIDIFDFQRPKWGFVERGQSEKRFGNLICKWLFNGDDRNVCRVYVNGRPVVYRE
ncbi:DEKNAAC104835 [Brettanomyces naardenensis]|uniref:Guanine deaminase n=1 Tax=Brettanomyces naardenensis TaxID=13370 RepID=A0A448YRZ8_BRENA|nr:DEKNAAC104835 [Brettanomyces naardenensis]